MSVHYRSRVVYPNRKKESRKRVAGLIFLVFGICAFVILLAWGLYSFAQLERFHINSITVEGTRVLSRDDIRALAEREIGGSLFFIIPKNHYVFASSRRIAEVLRKEFPRIKTISARKIFPDGIKIVVEERTEWGIYCGKIPNPKSQTSNQNESVAATSTALTEGDIRGNSCGYIDREGVLFEYPLEISGAFLPMIFDGSRSEIRVGERIVDESALSFFDGARDAAERELGVVFTELDITEKLSDDYRVYTSEGWYALVPRSGDQAFWLYPMKVLLERELKNRAGLEYIDARFGNKIFYKRKP
jgi:hypothetical protein